jgi:hypothetical protein
LENNLAAAASIRAGQEAARAEAPALSERNQERKKRQEMRRKKSRKDNFKNKKKLIIERQYLVPTKGSKAQAQHDSPLLRAINSGFSRSTQLFSKKSQPGAYTVYAPGCAVFMEN